MREEYPVKEKDFTRIKGILGQLDFLVLGVDQRTSK
jgi:hypothetical protein